MNRICEECGTKYSFTKKDIKKQLVFKKGEIFRLPNIVNDNVHFYLWSATKNLYGKYIVCPACDKESVLTKIKTPGIMISDEECKNWELLTVERADKED